jgi:hypothetical protein
LLSLTADGGTSIQGAFERVLGLDGESIIITDAIDPDVDQGLVKRVMERARLIILEPAEYYDWVKPYINDRVVIARRPEDVVEFLR